MWVKHVFFPPNRLQKQPGALNKWDIGAAGMGKKRHICSSQTNFDIFFHVHFQTNRWLCLHMGDRPIKTVNWTPCSSVNYIDPCHVIFVPVKDICLSVSLPSCTSEVLILTSPWAPSWQWCYVWIAPGHMAPTAAPSPPLTNRHILYV